MLNNCRFLVAILVVVDVWFRLRNKLAPNSDCYTSRNPCCSGCLVSTVQRQAAAAVGLNAEAVRRNPCCSGCLVSTKEGRTRKQENYFVAILVVVDVWFRLVSTKNSPQSNRNPSCRNPCCSGCLVSTIASLD